MTTAKTLLKAYGNVGLKVGVSFFGSWLGGSPRRWLVLPEAWFTKQIWWPEKGLDIERGENSSGLPDSEEFSLQSIVEAPDPDIDYIGIVDFFRLVCIGWNKIFGGVMPVSVPDLWGTIRVKAKTGQEVTTLQFLTHPRQSWNILVEFSTIMLEEIEDAGRENEVDKQARFEEAVAARRRELRQKGGD